jgi:hypothetical protein
MIAREEVDLFPRDPKGLLCGRRRIGMGVR